jgi:hypothetical protein
MKLWKNMQKKEEEKSILLYPVLKHPAMKTYRGVEV